MAQHVHDPAVIERRLRPIYDLLEAGNSKKALQETDKVLKKNPHLQCARALKALSLLRLGRDDESQTIITELEESKPSDEATLQVMTFYYRETEQLSKICQMYAEAAKQVPANEEIYSHLFISYVRINDFKSQQTVALQLYKLRPKNPYYFWAVMSVVLQALRGPESKDKTKSSLLLALAQRMIDKLINDNKLDAAQEIQLYLSILQHQGKYEEALNFLQNPLCVKLYPSIPVMERFELMKKVNKWAEINVLLKELLVDNLDRWDYYKEYLHSSVQLMKSNDKSEGVDADFTSCHQFLCQLSEMGKTKRGPYLAKLELHKIMRECNEDAHSLVGDFTEMIVDYFKMFGDKPCCSNDLRMYMMSMEQSKRIEVVSRLLVECGISSTTLPQNKEQMQQHIGSLQISRFCGAHSTLSSEHLIALYTALSLHYEHGLNAFGINLLSTDLGPSDPYALLAVYIMYDLAIASQSSERLVEALCLLHYLLANSPSNFHAKLLCLQIYHILGCGWGAYKSYESLEVKHIQLDSMGYLHCAHLPSIGIATMAKQLYESTLKFFTTSYKDSFEYLAMSYKFGSFSKLEEFMDFRDRLSNSLHYSLISVECLLLEIVTFCWTPNQNMTAFKNMNIKPAEDRIVWDEIADNRDLSVIVKWEPNCIGDSTNETNDETIFAQESFKQDRELLRLRSLLLRLVASCVEFGYAYDGPKLTDCRNTLVQLRDLWTAHFGRIRAENYQKTSNKFLVNLLPSRLHTILYHPYETVFTFLAEFLIALYDGGNKNSGRCPKTMADNLIRQIEIVGVGMVCDTIRDHNNSSDMIWNRRFTQESVVCAVEILSLVAFAVTATIDRLGNLTATAHPKKNKKKDDDHNSTTGPASSNHQHHSTINDKSRHTILQNVLRTLKQQYEQIDAALDGWNCPVLSKDLTESLAALSLNPNVEILVNGTFREDHIYTVKELKIILKDKLKMVNIFLK